MKQFDILYVNDNFELVKYNCLAQDITKIINDLPDGIPAKSVICIKDTTWDEYI